MSPLISVVIPTYNRLDRLRRVLDALEAQTCPLDRFEVVVVSDGSTDGTDEELAGPATRRPLRLVSATQANAGPAAARNHGIELASSPTVLFIDDDVVADRDLVAQHLDWQQRHGSDIVVVGPMRTPDDHRMSSWVAWEQAMLYKQYDAMDAGLYPATFRQFYTGNASAPRARLLEAGGFDVTFRRAEDVELAFRLDKLGVPFAWNRAAIGYHYAERPFPSWLRTAADYGRNDVVFSEAHGRDPGLRIMAEEFRARHAVVRLATRARMAQPWLGSALVKPLKAGADLSHRLGVEAGSRLCLSVLYHMAYYGAVADELGGADAFRRTMAGAA